MHSIELLCFNREHRHLFLHKSWRAGDSYSVGKETFSGIRRQLRTASLADNLAGVADLLSSREVC